jgi:hypothetical protein
MKGIRKSFRFKKQLQRVVKKIIQYKKPDFKIQSIVPDWGLRGKISASPAERNLVLEKKPSPVCLAKWFDNYRLSLIDEAEKLVSLSL